MDQACSYPWQQVSPAEDDSTLQDLVQRDVSAGGCLYWRSGHCGSSGKMHIHCRGKTQAFSGGSIRSRLSSEVVQFLCIFLMPINMLAAMATAIAIIHVISAPINASDKPLLTFGP